MPFASGSRVEFTYIEESTRGTTPGSPTMQLMRINNVNINPDKSALESEEIRSDRETVTFRHGQRSGSGSIVCEAILGNSDDWLRYALGGTWETASNANDIGITNPDQLVCSSNSLVTDGFRVGDIVTLAGLTVSGDNGDYRLTAVAAGAATLKNLDGTAPALTTEAENATPTVTLKGSRCSVGTNLVTATGERGLDDIAEYLAFEGMAVNGLGVAVVPDQLPKFTFDIIAMNFKAPTSTSLDGTPTAAVTNEAMAPIDGAMWEGGVKTNVVTAMNLSLANNRSIEGVVGATSSPDVFEGNSQTTGSLSMLVEDSAHLTKFTAETPTKIWFRMVDPDDTTEFLNIVMNRVKYTGAPINPPQTGAIVMDLPFRALRDPTTGVSLSIQRSNA